MRILFVHDNLISGGKERRIIELLKGMDGNPEFELGLVLLEDKLDYTYIFDLNITFFFLKRRKKLDFKIFFKLFSIINKFKPDIVHFWSALGVFYSIPVLLRKDYVVINNLIADSKAFSMAPTYHFLTRLIYPISNYVISNSIAGLKSYKAPSNSLCIYNGIDMSRFNQLKDESTIKDELNIHTEYVVVMVARFEKSKDYLTYIEAAKAVLHKRFDVTFLAVGGGSLLEKLKSTIDQKYLSNIVFTGRRNDVESIVNVADIGVLSTDPHKHGEGISNSILEYMALKKPVIASEGGGTNEVVINNYNGFLIKPSDPAILSEKILLLLNNIELQRKFGENGRKSIEDNYTQQHMINSYVNIYKQSTRVKM